MTISGFEIVIDPANGGDALSVPLTPRQRALKLADEAQLDAEKARENAEWCAKRAGERERAALNYRHAEAMALEFAATRTRDAALARIEAEGEALS